MEFVTARAEKELERALLLPARGDEQDWAVELADPSRVQEFISKYPEYQADDELSFGLVSLLIASFDDLIAERINEADLEYFEIINASNEILEEMYTETEIETWKEIHKILKGNKKLFSSLINYWCSDEIDTAFATSLFFRKEFR